MICFWVAQGVGSSLLCIQADFNWKEMMLICKECSSVNVINLTKTVNRSYIFSWRQQAFKKKKKSCISYFCLYKLYTWHSGDAGNFLEAQLRPGTLSCKDLGSRYVWLISFRIGIVTIFLLFRNSDVSKFPNYNKNEFKRIQTNKTKFQMKF